jgi:phosphoenolpyruvate carboxykinase (ATP)
MPIQATRRLLNAALAGQLDEVDYRVDEVFGFEVPVRVPGVEPSLLDPRTTWRDADVYDVRARELARLFSENFEGFAEEAGPEVAAAGPRA